MMRTRWLKWLAFVVIGMLPLAAGAGESPLSQLPADTSVLISIHGVERTQKRLEALVEKAVPDLAAAAKDHVKELLEKVLEGRKLSGLDPEGPVFVAITTLPQGGMPPEGALVAKVTDYMAFRNGLLTEEERKNLKKKKAGYEVTTIDDKEVFFIHRNGYVVMASQKEVAEQFLKAKGTGLEGKLSKRVADRLLRSDAAVYVNMTAINKEYGEMLQGARQFLPAMIENAGQIDQSMVKFIKAYFEGIFQAIQDSKHLLLTVSVPPEGLAIHFEAGFGKDTPTNKFLAVVKPAALTGLDSLPPGYLGYAAMAWGPEGFKTIEPLMRGFFATSEEADTKALDKALDEVAEAGPGQVLMASGLRSQGLTVAQFKDPAKAADGMLKMFQALRDVKTFATVPLKEKPLIRPNAQTYRGVKFHHYAMKWDFEKQFENLPVGGQQLVEAMKKQSGEGISAWFGPLDGAVVSVQAKDWKTAEKMLNRYLEKKATVGGKYKSFDRVRERLPVKSTAVGLVSVPQMVGALAQYGALIMQALGMAAPELPASKEAEPFLGVSLTLQSGYAGVDVWIPAETAGVVRRTVEAFKHAAQGQ